jgi:hypothetical protein
MKMNRLIAQILFIAILLVCGGCTSIFRIDGPYNGKVLDAETKQPLEGVVVLGIWRTVQLTVAGPTREFFDSVELLTDKNGEFRISGKGLRLFSNLDEMDIVIYKAGYKMRDCPWSNFKTRTGGQNIQWDGNKAIISLRKMSYEERKKSGVPTGPNIDPKRQQFLTNEINKEKIELYNPL